MEKLRSSKKTISTHPRAITFNKIYIPEYMRIAVLLTSVTVRTDILAAINRPPMTASPVQRACPRIPRTQTPYTSSLAAVK